METLYRPEGVEERWQQTWEDEGLYAADADDPRDTFVVAFPPPNVTGELHMGHALQLALADALVRWRRKQGYNCSSSPVTTTRASRRRASWRRSSNGTGSSRHELGRAAFEDASGSGFVSTAARS